MTNELGAFARLLIPADASVIAKRTKLTKGAVEHWKRGRSLPPAALLDKIAAAARVSLDDLRDAYTEDKLARRAAKAAKSKPNRRRTGAR